LAPIAPIRVVSELVNLLDFLQLCNSAGLSLDAPGSVKLARHRSQRWDLEWLRRIGQFEEYQSRQAKEAFSGANYLVSFMGEGSSNCRFLGLYEVGPCRWPAPPWGSEWPYPEMNVGGCIYELSKLPGFDDLEDRLIIDWGKGTRSWIQWMKPKQVVELRPRGHARDFPGYLDFILGFDELRQIIENPDANRTWHAMLSAVAGVYLITDTKSGDLYVGSAYGKGGILARWTAYVRTQHGGNKLLRKVLEESPRQHLWWKFSILRTLPRTLTNREVIEVETQFKAKLGSRSFGLNLN